MPDNASPMSEIDFVSASGKKISDQNVSAARPADITRRHPTDQKT